MPLVSVIVPVFNAQETIEGCVLSILKQTYSAIQIILINDGSVDSSYAICENFRNSYSNIVLVEQCNKGPSAARNAGIRIAQGEYIVFVDADDRIDENLIETLVMNRKDVDLVIGNIGNEPQDYGKNHREWMIEETEQVDASILMEKFIYSKDCHIPTGPVAKLYNKSVLEKNDIWFNERFCQGEDFLFNLEYLCCCNRINILLKTVMYYVNNNHSSLTRTYRKDWWKIKKATFDVSIDILKKHGKEKKYFDVLCANQIIYAIGVYTNEACQKNFRYSKMKLVEVSRDNNFKIYYMHGKKYLSRKYRWIAALIYYKMDFIVYLVATIYVKHISKRVYS